MVSVNAVNGPTISAKSSEVRKTLFTFGPHTVTRISIL
jgi:hypothetical protein